jgi:hypothetical protein
MFDDFGSDGSDSSSGIGDVLDALTTAAGTAYANYQLSASGIIPVPGQPGVYAQTGASTAKVITPVANSQNQTLLYLALFVGLGFVAFKAVK